MPTPPTSSCSVSAYYVSKSNTSLPEFAVWSLIAQTVDFVVHIDLVRNAVERRRAVRRVTSIIEVGGLGEAGGVSSTEVWGIDDDGRARAGRAAVAAAPAIGCGSPDTDAELFAASGRLVSLESAVLVVSTLAGVAAVVVAVSRPTGHARAPTAARRRARSPVAVRRWRVGALVVCAFSGWVIASLVVRRVLVLGRRPMAAS